MRLYFAPKPTIACETLGIYYRLNAAPFENRIRFPHADPEQVIPHLVLQQVPGVQSRMQLGAAENFAATSEWHKDQVLAPKSSIPGTSSQLSLSIAWNCDDALTRTQLE